MLNIRGRFFKEVVWIDLEQCLPIVGACRKPLLKYWKPCVVGPASHWLGGFPTGRLDKKSKVGAKSDPSKAKADKSRHSRGLADPFDPLAATLDSLEYRLLELAVTQGKHFERSQ